MAFDPNKIPLSQAQRQAQEIADLKRRLQGRERRRQSIDSVPAHAPTHATGGTDPITPASIGAATDADLDSHAADTTDVHGITDTDNLLAPDTDASYQTRSSPALDTIYTPNSLGSVTHPYDDAVLEDDPLVFFDLDETTGNAIDNVASVEMAPTDSGSMTRGASGPDASVKSTLFSANALFSNTTDAPAFPSTVTDYTIECWARWNATNSYDSMIAAISDSWDSNSSVFWSAFKSDRRLGVTVANSNWIKSDGQIPLDTWTHCAIVKTGTSVKFYINGVLDSTKTQDISSNAIPASVTRYSTKLSVGNHFNHKTYYGTRGNLCKVAIYDSALSATRVAAHYAADFESSGSFVERSVMVQVPVSLSDIAGGDDGSTELKVTADDGTTWTTVDKAGLARTGTDTETETARYTHSALIPKGSKYKITHSGDGTATLADIKELPL